MDPTELKLRNLKASATLESYFYGVQLLNERRRRVVTDASTKQQGLFIKSEFLTHLENQLTCAQANQVSQELFIICSVAFFRYDKKS